MIVRARLCLLVFAGALAAPVLGEPPRPMPATGTVQAAFSPWDDAEGLLVDAIRRARREIRVQAFSFTSRRVATALIAARRRGVDVRVIADAEQASSGESTRLADLVAGGVPVLLDGVYRSAHSKVMIIDGLSAEPAVVTGSYNWTYAAQYRNAENLLVLRGNPALASAYLQNWERHAASATPWKGAP